MNQFFITVSNGLLTKEHRDKIGSSVWEFMWCLDKITIVTKEGKGIILGGKPINLSDIAEQLGVTDDTVSRNLHKLEEEKYLTILRTPYGLVIHVNKAKKRFYKSVESDGRDSTKMSNAITSDKNVESLRKNVESNKTIQLDITELDNSEKKFSQSIIRCIDSFKEINPSAFKGWYKNKTQRKALNDLLESYGEELVLKVIKILLKTNGVPYMPNITTPVQLKDKWSSLENALKKQKSKLQTKETNYVI